MLQDHEIVDLLFAHEELGLKELSRKYGKTCDIIAKNILGSWSDAEECTNDAYFEIWKTIPPNRPYRLSAYLFAIVRHRCIARYHEKTAQKRNSHYDTALDELQECISSPDTVEKALETKELSEKLNHFLETLKEEDRKMFVRRYWYADSVTNIATLTHKSAHYVSVRLSRIRMRLKKYLSEKDVMI